MRSLKITGLLVSLVVGLVFLRDCYLASYGAYSGFAAAKLHWRMYFAGIIVPESCGCKTNSIPNAR